MRELRTGGIDITGSELFSASATASGTVMNRQAVLSGPRRIQHCSQVSSRSWKDIHFQDKACFSVNISKLFEKEKEMEGGRENRLGEKVLFVDKDLRKEQRR